MGTGRAELGGSGLQTAALAVGAGSPNAQVEEYDGSSWTSGGALNTGRSIATATGPQTTQTHPTCLLYTSPSPRDGLLSRMPSSA